MLKVKKKSRVELYSWSSQTKAVEGECQVNVKRKHEDNVQWGLHLLQSSKGKKGKVKEQMHGIHDVKGKV